MTGRIRSISRIALGLFFVLIFLSGIYFARQSGADPQAYSNDFNVYYHAASEVISGRDPYQHSLAEWTPYLYPPLLAELMTPLALLPLAVAAFIWFLISALSVAAAALMSSALCDQSRGTKACERAYDLTNHSRFNPRAARILIATIAIVLLIRFTLDNFNLGQVNPLVGALSVAHVYFYSRNKKGLSAFAFALAASIKLTPVILIAYHIAKWRLKFVAACLSLLAAITVLSFLPFGSRGPETFKVFFNRTVKNEQGFDLEYAGNQSLRGAVARLAGDNARAGNVGSSESAREPMSAITLIISIALLALAVLAARTAPDALATAPLFCCLVMLSPLSWKAHFIVLILPVVYLICRALQESKSQRAYLITSLIIVFALFNLTSPKVVGLPAAEWADAHSLVFAGALVIYLTCIWQASRRFVNLNQSDQLETDCNEHKSAQ